MLEAYWAFADFEMMAALVEDLICHSREQSAAGSLSNTRAQTAIW